MNVGHEWHYNSYSPQFYLNLCQRFSEQQLTNLSCLINLVMILLRTNLAKWFHFARPALSSLASLKDLEQIMQKRVIKSIKEANDNTLQGYSFLRQIQNKLAIDNTPAKDISERTVTVSIINPNTLQHRSMELRLDKDLKSLIIEPEESGLPFPSPENALLHFSKKRGVPVFAQLSEYALDEKTMLVFNLPENISEQDIQVMLKEKPKNITFKYCTLGLPAYAKVEFEDIETFQRAKNKNKKKEIVFGDRVSKIKDASDNERLSLKNRRLVVHIDQNASLPKTLIEMSRFGRVMHIDWPIEATLNPSVEEIKKVYKNSSELVRINKIHPNGTIDSEYYPNVEIWRVDEDEREVTNILDKSEALQQAYENRCRFAKQIDVLVGKEYGLSLKNRGYCVVTFSTSEQCQNYYFTYGASTKMQLVGEKQQFQFDPLFRKELLRIIDNEYLSARKHELSQKKKSQSKIYDPVAPGQNIYTEVHPKQLSADRSDNSYNLYNKILLKRYLSQSQQKTSDYRFFKKLQEQNPLLEWQARHRLIKQQHASSTTKTFDELAQVQLYGRVLPKDRQSQKIKIQSTKFKVPKEIELINEHNLLTEIHHIKYRNKMIKRERIRSNRLADQALGITHQKDQQHQQEEQAPHQEHTEHKDDQHQIGKQHFATFKPNNIYRQRNQEENANYQRRYCHFIRNTIYQYMGVFHDKLIEEAVTGQLDPLNPQSLKFSDGSPLLSENEVTDVLQFRRDFPRAQSDYQDYIYGSQFIKSSGLDLKNIYSNFKQVETSAMQQLSDIGVVQQVRKVPGVKQQIEKKANILNTEVASFGQEYRQETLNDQHYLVKVRKLEHLFPLDRVAHLEKFVQLFKTEITEEEAKIFQQHYQEMKEKGTIPEEVRKAFNISENITLDELFTQMGQLYGITKKDLEMIERSKKYSKEELKEDLKKQEKIQHHRLKKKKVGSYDFAKDPSQIYVKDREGYFKVSRYRQI